MANVPSKIPPTAVKASGRPSARAPANKTTKSISSENERERCLIALFRCRVIMICDVAEITLTLSHTVRPAWDADINQSATARLPEVHSLCIFHCVTQTHIRYAKEPMRTTEQTSRRV